MYYINRRIIYRFKWEPIYFCTCVKQGRKTKRSYIVIRQVMLNINFGGQKTNNEYIIFDFFSCLWIYEKYWNFFVLIHPANIWPNVRMHIVAAYWPGRELFITHLYTIYFSADFNSVCNVCFISIMPFSV